MIGHGFCLQLKISKIRLQTAGQRTKELKLEQMDH
ncbi:hypothetical protein Gotur_031897 [Gossypium turneri]